VYHYAPFEHALEQRVTLTAGEWHAIAVQLPPGSILVGLTSIYWRESWKYGERAFRYCHHDVGHAIGTVSLAAAVLGWQTRLLECIADQELAKLLCIHGQQGLEAEHQDCLLALFPAGTSAAPAAVHLQLPSALLERLTTTTPIGTENPLSREHHSWPIIDEVAQATDFHGLLSRRELEHGAKLPEAETGTLPERRLSARRLIQQRRSAVAMDGCTSLSRELFYHMLARVTPHLSPIPFQMLPWRPRIALVLFVHRIDALPPGLYLLAREASHRQSLQTAMQQEFRWEKPTTCPAGLELYLLQPGDVQHAAEIISCHQTIAAAGAFALGMLAEFESSLIQQGPWFYPRLFWEAGLLGQVLYLEAEAAGIRATGIGCFFDDALHQLFGIKNNSWQSLYHFTVGGPVEDIRLKTLHPYFHLGKESTF
jgi:nitroreductase